MNLLIGTITVPLEFSLGFNPNLNFPQCSFSNFNKHNVIAFPFLVFHYFELFMSFWNESKQCHKSGNFQIGCRSGVTFKLALCHMSE